MISRTIEPLQTILFDSKARVTPLPKKKNPKCCIKCKSCKGCKCKKNPPVTVQPRKVSPTKKGRFVMEGKDVTNHYAFEPVVSVNPIGQPHLEVMATKKKSWRIGEHVGNSGKIGNLVRINMFRRTAGFKIVKNGKPIEGKWRAHYWDAWRSGQPDYIISVETGGKHYYALSAVRARYGILASFPSKRSEPRLRIETRGVMTDDRDPWSGPPKPLADLSLSVRGKAHPLYDSFWITTNIETVPWEEGYKMPKTNPGEDGEYYLEDFGETMTPSEAKKKFKSEKLRGPVGSEKLFLQLAEKTQDFGEASGWIKGGRLFYRPGAKHLNEAMVTGYIMEDADAFFHTHPRVWEPSQTSPDDFKVYHGLFTLHGIQDHFTVMGDRIDWFRFAKSNRNKPEEIAEVVTDFEQEIEDVFADAEMDHVDETDGNAPLRDRTKAIVKALNTEIPEYNVRFKCYQMSPEQITSSKN